jgi:hypothetical protein
VINLSLNKSVMKKVLLWLCHSQTCTTLILLLLLQTSISYAQVIRYVDASKSAGAGQDGTTWSKAYPTLKAALDVANANTAITEIQVAKGTYYPTGTQSGTDRTATFGIYRNDLVILGGYPTGGAGARDWSANPTILSGEINNISSVNDNSYHVMVVAGLGESSASVLVEGFQIQAGRANGGSTEDTYNGHKIQRNGGAGIAIYENSNASIRIRNSVISGNWAADIGAGVYIRNSSPTFISCLISGNYADYCGGFFALSNGGKTSGPTLVNCTIAGNHSNNGAGGIRNSGSGTTTIIANTIVYGNSGSAAITNNENGIFRTAYSLLQGMNHTHNDNGFATENLAGDVNPLFEAAIAPTVESTGGDYRLKANSPCLDRGQNFYIQNLGGEVDLLNNRRQVCTVDMGAYEFPAYPVIQTQPVARDICPGATTTFGVAATNVDRYEWQVKRTGSSDFVTVTNGGIYSNATSATLGLTNVPFTENGNIYRTCASTISTEVSLTVKPTVSISNHPQNQTICPQGSASFSVQASNATSYRWEYNDGSGFKNVPSTSPYSGTNTSTLQIGVVSEQMSSYTYRVVVRGECNSEAISESKGFTFHSSPAISSQTFCQNSAPTVANLQSLGNNLNWYETSVGGIALLPVTPLTTKTFYVSQTVNGCESFRKPVSVAVISSPLPPVATSPQMAVATATLSALTVTGSNLKWYGSDNGGSELSVSVVLQSGKYYVSQTVNGCESPRLEIAVSTSSSRVLFVKHNGTGTGISWEDASGDLQAMMDVPMVRQVWVAKGTYLPSKLAGNGTGSRDKAFVLKKGVKIYGGFEGDEATLAERDLTIGSNRSILSGDLDNNDIGSKLNLSNNTENVHHVLIAAGDMEGVELNGFTISGGNANGMGEVIVNGHGITKNDGGGIFIRDATSLKLINISILTNRANTSGGGVFCWKSSPTFEHVIIEGNAASYSGGFHNYDSSFPHLTHVTMKGNYASADGGAMYNSNSSADLLHVHISGNTASNGGGIYNNNSALTLTNVLISNNTATALGGAVYNLSASPVFTNVTIVKNTALLGTGAAIFLAPGSSAEMRNSVLGGNFSGVQGYNGTNLICHYSLIQGVTTSDGNGNLDGNTDPMFLNVALDDYRLQPCSPAVNAGDPAFTGDWDLAGQPRVKIGRVDMGAYEYQGDVIPRPEPPVIDALNIFCNNTLTVADIYPGISNWKWYETADMGPVLSSTTLLTTRTYFISQTVNGCESLRTAVPVTLLGVAPPLANAVQTMEATSTLSDLEVSGSNLKWYDSASGGNELPASTVLKSGKYYVSQTSNSCESLRLEITVSVTNATLYVKQDGIGTGTSWEDASGDLQAMIDAIGVNQVWVAKGTYLPSKLAGNGTGSRDKAFVLKKGVKIYGGFKGDEAALDERDLTTSNNRSVLSGDFSNNDVVSGQGRTLTLSNNQENAYHVLIAAGDMYGAELNGFTISGGNASGTGEVMVNGHGITKNDGGGIFIRGAWGSSALKFTNISILGNGAIASGGGVFCWASSPTFEHVIIEGNTASFSGAFHNYSTSSPHLAHVTMRGNNASEDGGAMYNSNSLAQLFHVDINGNTAKNGGGIYNYNSSPTLTNVLIRGNAAAELGGAVYTSSNSWPVFTNVTIVKNEAGSGGGGMFNFQGSLSQMRNSVLWGNGSGVDGYNGNIICYNSLVQGLTTSDGNGNLDGNTDPLFVDAAQDDYRLQSCSPVINKGATDLSEMNLPETDLAGYPRIHHDRIDMGAYEFQGDVILRRQPPVIAAQNFCNNSTTVADLLLLGSSLKWYEAADGGLALSSTTILTTQTYFVSQTTDGCESFRREVSVTVRTASPDANSAQVVAPGSTLSSLIVSGSNLRWYDAASGGNELPFSTVLQSGKYYVSQTINGCESSPFEITVGISSSGILFVKHNGTGSGISWEDASGDLQEMIDVPMAEQIWVAKGTYLPSKLAGNGTENRDKAFVLRKDVRIYGGFSGEETNLNERNLQASSNKTILSGDISSDDNDAYHVVIAAGELGEATLDGVTISGGRATEGGSFIDVNGVSISRNEGAGVCIMRAPDFVLQNVRVTNNIASYRGGGLAVWRSSPTLTNVVVDGNKAQYSGGIDNSRDSHIRMYHSVISRNEGTDLGGGIGNDYSSVLTFQNVTISHNTSADGGGVFMEENEAAAPFTFVNTIIWGNDSYGELDPANLSYTYSLVQGLPASGTNLNEDPLFVDPDNGDFRLQPCSPAINAGDPTITGGLDIAGRPRVQLGRIDMGAYEYQGDAVLRPEPPVIAAQNFCNENVTVADLLLLGSNLRWYESADIGPELSSTTLLTTKTYFVSQSGDECESSRTAVSVRVSTSSPVANSAQVVAPGSTLSALFVSGSNLRWYDEAAGGNEFPASTVLQSGKYYVSQTINSCESSRFEITVGISSSGTLYVKQGATGIGTSWEDASGNLQEVIEAPGALQVWVAKGTYWPSKSAGNGTANRDKAFVLRKDVRIYGGFAGEETNLNERNVQASNQTILSGDISSDDDDDAYHVVIAAGDLGNATLDGFTISGGRATGDRLTAGGTITVNGFEFARNEGAGLFIRESPDLVLQNLTVTNNTASYSGGGMSVWQSSPTLTNVVVDGNKAAYSGGIDNYDGSHIRMYHSVISRNEALVGGGGMHNDDSSVLTFQNVTISHNTAGAYGGGVYMDSESASPFTFVNTIIWGNDSYGEHDPANLSYAYSLVQGLTASGTNLNADPLFVDPDNGDFRLQACSPAINKGAIDTGGMNLPETDLAGYPRIQLGRIDMGAYEFQGDVVLRPEPPVVAAQNFCNNSTTVADLLSLGSNLNWYEAADAEPALSSTTLLISQTYFVSQTGNGCESSRTAVSVTVRPSFPVANSAQVVAPGSTLSALFVSGSNLRWYDTAADGNELPASTVLQSGKYYVSQTINGCESPSFEITVGISSSGILYVKQGATGIGTSWEDASGNLQEVIEAPGALQVWVAKGTYWPSKSAGNGTDNRDKAFVLRKDVRIYGGFAGEETNLNERNVQASNQTILSGDISSDDDDDAYHVVIAAGDLGNATLDGFTISGGRATGDESFINVNGVEISRDKGAGLFIKESPDLVLGNLTVTNNIASYSGGGLTVWRSSPTLTNVVVDGNKAEYSGGIDNYDGSHIRMYHSVISRNEAYSYGGGMYNDYSSLLTFQNVTISHNTAPYVGGVYMEENESAMPYTFVNTIIWGNDSYGVLASRPTDPSYTYSLVQDLTSLGTNMNKDPLFVDPDNGDFRLQFCSPAINTGDPSITEGLDIAGQPRVQLGRIDMGAYEASTFTDDGGISLVSSAASTASSFQLPLSTTWYAADCNNLLLSVVSSGNQPVQGITHAKTWIGAIEGFVQRHYEIAPDNNATAATGRITLYFTQADFDAYNKPDKPMLPKYGDDVSGIANLRIQKRGGTSSDNTGNPSSYPGTAQIIDPSDTDIVWNASQSRWEVSFNVTGFSGFFAYAVVNIPLPVTLINFKADREEHGVVLTWNTTLEVNASHFEIERSANAKTWEVLGTVNANGTTPGNYEFIDTTPLYSVNYYRLKMVDMDGSFSHSRIAFVHNGDNTSPMQVSVYPNPVSSGRLTVTTSGAGTPDVTVYDLLGRKVNVNILKGTEGKMDLDVSMLSVGMYVVSIRRDGEVTSLRFMVN